MGHVSGNGWAIGTAGGVVCLLIILALIMSSDSNDFVIRFSLVITAVFFALSHAILQQSIVACTMGIVIGYLAVQTNSIWPCMAFHMLHNGLGVSVSRLTPELLGRVPMLKYVVDLSDDATMLCPWPVVITSALVAAAILVWFHRLPNGKSKGINWPETGHGVFGASV